MKTQILKLTLLFVILFSTNKSYSQWQDLNTGTFFTLFSISAVDNDVVWACASGNFIIRTTNGGTTWINVGNNIPPPAGVHTCIYAFDQNSAIFSSYAGSPLTSYIYKTTNGGQNWGLVLTQSPGFITALTMKNSTEGFLLGAPQNGRWSLWRTSNAGVNWDSTGLYLPENGTGCYENSLIYSGSNIAFGIPGAGIYHSTNDGNNWTLQDLTSGGFPYPSAIYYETSSRGYSSSQLNIIKTTNNGINWSGLPGSSGSEIVRGIVSYMNEIWYVREVTPSIFYSSNGGSNWSIQHTSPSGTGYRFITKSRTGNTLWASTVAGEITKYILPVVLINQPTEIPNEFKLFQNYPNPFNPSTKINYELPITNYVSLKVFDITGREVASLVNEKQNAGRY